MAGLRVAVLLAAGRSCRFGQANKLLVGPAGRRLIDRAVAVARAAPAGRVLVAIGHDRRRIAAAVAGPRIVPVLVRDHREGMGASLRAAAAAAWPCERLMLLFLADMPAVPPILAARLLRALRPGDIGVRPAWRGRPGHPVLLRLPLDRVPGGDRGAGRGMRLRTVAGPRGCVQDIDTRAMFARAGPRPRPMR